MTKTVQIKNTASDAVPAHSRRGIVHQLDVGPRRAGSPTLLATFLNDPFAKLMTKEFFVLQWMRTQLALQQLASFFASAFSA
jgi:hypothetical protein